MFNRFLVIRPASVKDKKLYLYRRPTRATLDEYRASAYYITYITTQTHNEDLKPQCATSIKTQKNAN